MLTQAIENPQEHLNNGINLHRIIEYDIIPDIEYKWLY